MKINTTKIKAAIVILLLPILGFGQQSDLGNWLIYIGSKKINDKINIHHEVQYRNYDAIGDLEQLLLRTGIGYNLTPNNNNVLLGYGFIHSQNYVSNDDKVNVDEHRLFQQFITKQKFTNLNLQHRYRLEERWVEKDFKMRFRYFLGLSYPIADFNESAQSLYLSAYNEIFLNFKETVFDRNRTYFGLGYKFNKGFKLELGYMNQFFTNSGRDQVNVIGFCNF